MRSRVSLFCDQIIEAGWLLALIIVPLYFNVYSSRVFEPDKITILRSIVLIMALAWLIRTLGEGVRGPRILTSAPDGADPAQASQGRVSRIVRLPLLLPTLVLVAAYVVSTIFSVTPHISLWGSYQRLQGTFTTFSYIVVFFMILQNLRRPEQLQRLLYAVVLTSLPISFYGILQHYGLDPLPWGGNVMARVASNMGNAIFISAYLIMVFPLTLACIVNALNTALEQQARRAKVGFAAFYGACALLQMWAWGALGVGRGLLVSGLLLVALALAALYLRRPLARFILLGLLGFVQSLQLVCILFSQSRGPMLGLGGALFFFALLYVFVRRWRKTALVLAGLVGLALAFLVLINLPQSPLSAVHKAPYIGQLGRVFEVGSGTGKVRVLIWEGAIDMLRAKPLRALVGYGPESMYVAYNPYYPPDLAHYEARNASPDRSHNETFDALLMTGVTGLLAYMYLFGSIFYYGLLWLGLVPGARARRAYVAAGVAGGLMGIGLAYILDGSLRFAGVGLPIGFLAGVALYAAASALALMLGRSSPATGNAAAPRSLKDPDVLLLIALLASMVGHFIEIHFGIAIAATRTYFWAYAALFVLLGQGMASLAEPGAGDEPTPQPATAGSRATSHGEPQRQNRARSRERPGRAGGAPRVANPPKRAPTERAGNPSLAAMALLAGLVLATMFWDYTTNPLGQADPLAVLITSLTTMASKQAPEQVSLGMLALFTTTGLAALGMLVAQHAQDSGAKRHDGGWLAAAGQSLAIMGGASGLYAIIHAARLAPGVNLPNLVYEYYVVLGLFWVALGIVLVRRLPRPQAAPRVWRVLAYIASLLATLALINVVNANVVRADVLYKQGLRYDQQGAWEGAARLYNEALKIAPRQDFYYLFRGRALMEQAKQERDAKAREELLALAEESLLSARQLNPLNTDHTANLGRLYRTWAEMTNDESTRRAKLELSLQEYEQSVKLSPNNAQLWDEWASVYMAVGDPDQALAKLEHSAELDPQYAQTYLLLGDLHLSRQEWERAIEAYEKLIDLEPQSVPAWSSIGYAYSQLGQLEPAIEANRKILEVAPEDYNTLKNLALLYGDLGKPEDAARYAEMALKVAPEQDRAGLRQYIEAQQALVAGAKP